MPRRQEWPPGQADASAVGAEDAALPRAEARDPTVKRRPSVQRDIADQIISLIHSDRLPDGTHLTAAGLAAQFGVSRWPVQQALKALALANRLTHHPNRGFFVSAAAPLQMRPTQAPDRVREAYFCLGADLVGGRIGPTTSETMIRERYNLTRGEASSLLVRLAREGLAERRAGYGWSFSEVLSTPEALEQSYRLRLLIEPGALLEPGFSLPRATIDRLRRTELHLLNGGIEDLPADMLYEKASEFHETLIAGTGNTFLVESLRRVNRVRRLLIYRSMQHRGRYFRQSEEHLRLLDLLEASRNEEAAILMREHLISVMARQKVVHDSLAVGGDRPLLHMP